MRSTMALLAMLTLTVSCGDRVQKRYVENPFDNSENDARISELERKLEEQANQSAETAQTLTEILEELQDSNLELEETIAALEEDTALLFVEVAELYDNSIVKIIDPCGDKPGFDEVLLKTGDGRILAYFESGNNRHLSVIGQGSYRTTDGTNCLFEVTSSGVVLHIVDGVIIGE